MADYTGSFSGSFEGIFLGGVISSSNQLSIDWNSNVIANKPTTISPFQANSIISNNRFRETTYPAISASVSTRVTTLEVDVDTLSTQIAAAVSGTVPPGTISGSQQIADLGYLTSASAAALGFGSGGGTSIPDGTVSSSTQITNVINDAYISASAALSGFGSGEIYTAGLGITITSNVITLDTSSTHFIEGVSASAAASGFGSGGGGSNQAPTIADQTMSAVPESSSAGYSVGLITATDAEGNIITFASFTVSNVYLSTNPSVNLTSSLGGTSLYDPSVDPFQANSSGLITLKNSQFLNADVADTYVYLATATDPFATTSGSGFVTIPISQDASSSIGANGGAYYIIESAITADNLTTNSNGRTAGDVTFTSAVSQMWLVKSNPVGYVRFTNGTTQYTGSTSLALELAQNISGSGLTFDLGSTIGIEITASEVGFETTKQYRNHTLNIAKNFAPSGSMVRTDANLNTNGARSGNTIATLTWTDTESNSLHNPSFTLSSNAGLSSSFTSSYTYNIFPTGSLSAGTYYVSASVKDQHGFRFGSSSMSFTIAQAGAGTLTATGGFYVLESATGSEKIVTNTNGRPTGTQVDLNVSYSPQYNSAAVQSFTSSNALIAVSSTGLLTVGTSISGSGYLNSGSISSSITWRDQYNNVTSSYIFVTVTKNYAPDITFTNAGSTILNTNYARTSSNPTLTTITFSDPEGNPLNHNTFTFTNPSNQLSASRSGDSWLITPSQDLSASVYQMTASIRDIHGFNTATKTNTFEIIKAPIGTITAENFYIIESAVSGNFITNETDGSGSSADVNVSYTPTYGPTTPSATNFSASDAYGLVYANPTSGVLSIKQTLSGSQSAPSASTSFVVSVYWNDQYQNNGSGSITLNITPNYDPSASFAPQTLTAPVSSGSNLESVSIIDREAGVVSMSLSGDSAVFMNVVRVSETPFTASYQIQANTALTASTLLYTASIFDSYGNSGSFNRSLVISPAVDNPLLYVYAANPSSLTSGTYNAIMGIATVDSGTPNQILTYTVNTLSFAYQMKTGALGTASMNLAGGKKAVLLASASATASVELIVQNFGQISSLTGDATGSQQIIIMFPSGSDNLRPIPTSMAQAFGGTAVGEYVMQIQADGAGWANTIEDTRIHEIVLDTAKNGYTDWFMIGRTGYNAAASNYQLRIRPSSGSAQS
jgi:hypothetical protein